MTLTFEEWRVTGDPGPSFPQYDFVFGSPTRRAMGADEDPEAAARRFVEQIREAAAELGRGGWVDGPHLQHRTVTYTEWEPA